MEGCVGGRGVHGLGRWSWHKGLRGSTGGARSEVVEASEKGQKGEAIGGGDGDGRDETGCSRCGDDVGAVVEGVVGGALDVTAAVDPELVAEQVRSE